MRDIRSRKLRAARRRGNGWMRSRDRPSSRDKLARSRATLRVGSKPAKRVHASLLDIDPGRGHRGPPYPMKGPDAALAERALAAQQSGRRAEAEALWRHLLKVDPANPAVSFHLGVLLADSDRLEEAAERFGLVLTVLPSSAEAAGNLGFVHQRLGRLEDAVDLYRRALALQPDLAIVRNNLGGALHDLGRSAEAFEAYRALADHGDPRLAANLLTAMNLVPATSADFHDAARRWAARFAEPLTPPRLPRRDDPERRLRIGYVGAAGLRRHTLAMTWLPLIEAHDRNAVEPIVYSDLPADEEDDVSRHFQDAATWCCTRDLDDATLAARIRDDRIDVLIDGLGFAAGMRLLAFARRPAPIQIHFPAMSTTGMSAFDYIVADEQLVPSSAAPFFTETICYVPCGFLYRPFEPLPEPSRREGPLTFGSFNRLPKIGPDVVDAWARILRAAPDARLLLKTGGHLTPEMIKRYSGLFANAGVSPERLEFRGRTSDAEHFEHFRDIDVALDSFPHGGVLTTCDALAMGVPVVTRAGERVLERYGAALLFAAGFPDEITHSTDGYVDRAIELAGKRSELASARQERSRRMRASPLCDAPAFARQIEHVFRRLWRERCSAKA